MAEVSPRRVGSAFLFSIALVVLLSAAWINPWIGGWVKGAHAHNFADVQLSYFITAVFFGSVIGLLARKVSKGASWADGAVLLVVVVAALFLSDRYLLTRLRLPLWKHDAELHYRHRPGAKRTMITRDTVESFVSINRWGHHDTDFPRDKPPGEFRMLALGDSVTMGFGVTYDETYSAHLERDLREKATGYSSFEVINTGVHGYSTYQELRIFEESLAFDPDVVVLGFCLNDVTEPFVVSEEYGGVGLDYHGVTQTTTPLVGWLANETGYGRFFQRLAEGSKSVEAEKRVEIYNARRMAELSLSDPEMKEAWRITLSYLEATYDLARENGKPIVLLIFPFTFQLADESLREPQRILLEHAASHGVDAIDFAPIFQQVIFDDPEHLAFLHSHGYSKADIESFYKSRIDNYFFDEDHFKSEGNAVVADALFRYLCEHELVECTP